MTYTSAHLLVFRTPICPPHACLLHFCLPYSCPLAHFLACMLAHSIICKIFLRKRIALTLVRLHACTPPTLARPYVCTPLRLHARTLARLHACTLNISFLYQRNPTMAINKRNTATARAGSLTRGRRGRPALNCPLSVSCPLLTQVNRDQNCRNLVDIKDQEAGEQDPRTAHLAEA